jgi:hypothetical protein
VGLVYELGLEPVRVGGKSAAQRHCSRLQDKLKIVGMGDVAASLGIATGFVAEDVSSVLSPARASDITENRGESLAR